MKSEYFPVFGAKHRYYIEETGSTMDDAAEFPLRAPIQLCFAGRQTAGRGRAAGRVWYADSGESFLGTWMLDSSVYKPDPSMALKAGLAAALWAEDRGASDVKIKWPNDLLIRGKKTAGLLCEAKPDRILIGVGLNLNQKDFPPEIAGTAGSMFQAVGTLFSPREVGSGLEARLLESLSDPRWRDEVEARLWMRDRDVRFLTGQADSGRAVSGSLRGLDERGGLRIEVDGEERVFYAGELAFG